MSGAVPGLEILPGLTLLRILGRGAMGEAWLARDAERGEDVVAKVVPGDAPRERVALLRREARLVRKLSHPRIVPVHGFRSGERWSAVTLRYMPGGDAGSKRGAPLADVVRIGRDVADALAYLHGLGVVHRDVKVSNVLLDDEGRAHLADFGIAAVAQGDEEGLVVRGGGSRASMSPQQRAGEPAQPGDDLYALGALLFELVSGHPPLQDAPAGPPCPPALPPGRALPESLRALVSSLLEPVAEARPRSAAAVRDTLEATLAELGGAALGALRPPVPLQPPPRVANTPLVPAVLEARLGSAHARRRAGLALGEWALLSVLAVGAVASVLWLPRWARPPATLLPTPSPAPPQATPVTSASPVPAEAPPAAAAPEEDPAPPAAPPPSAARPARIAAAAAARETDSAPAPPPVPAPTPDRQAESVALERHRAAGSRLEQQEDWRGASGEYQAALGIDPHVAFALEGKERSDRRAALDDALDFHVRNAHRLSTGAVAREAEALLERARGIPAPGPRLRARIAALEQALGVARAPVAVVIESDGLTELTLSRVGRLGTLTRRSLDLLPGSYTLTGSRRGYRDVRREFTVTPGARPAPLALRCEEAF